MIRAIIIDDEPGAVRTLKNMLDSYCPNVQIDGIAGDIEEGSKLIEQVNPDLIFLDINMPGGTGLDLLEQYEGPAKTIFTTAYSEYAINAIRLSALDYLLKPIKKKDLLDAIGKFQSDTSVNGSTEVLKSILQKEKIERICIPVQSGLEIIQIEDINYAEAANAYTVFHLITGEKVVASKPIRDYEQMLFGAQFLRIHRSHLVNINQIKSYKKGRGGWIRLQDGTELEVSRQKKEELIALLSG